MKVNVKQLQVKMSAFISAKHFFTFFHLLSQSLANDNS